MKSVSRKELDEFLDAYPGPLVKDFMAFCEPPCIIWCDAAQFSGSDMVVASIKMNYDKPGLDDSSCQILK